MATLHFNTGQTAGIRLGDLGDAIAHKAGLNSNVIGPIKIADQFSQVKVPEELAMGIMKALGRTRLKGQKVTLRLYREKSSALQHEGSPLRWLRGKSFTH